jgi:hypothetical protein
MIGGGFKLFLIYLSKSVLMKDRGILLNEIFSNMTVSNF